MINLVAFFTFRRVIPSQLFLFGIVVLFALTLLSARADTPESLFIDACLNSGYNPKKFQTVQASFQRTIHTDGETKERLAQILADNEKNFRVAHQNETKEELESLWASVRETLIRAFGASTKKSQVSCLLKGTYYVLGENIKHHTPNQFRQRIYQVHDISETGGISDITLTLMHSSFASPTTYFEARLRDKAIIDLNTKVTTGAEIQLFGRMQGYWTEKMIGILLAGSDYKKFTFSQSGRKAFAEECRQQKFMFIKSGESEYDGGNKARIIDVMEDGTLFMRYWIDTSRGYICPLIRHYNSNGSTFKEFLASDYQFHQSTGLWYPTRYEETTFSNGAVMDKRTFVLEPETLQINKPVADAMFVLDVAQGMNIWDNRKGHDGQYRAVAEGQLSFKGGKFNLDDIDWIGDDEAMYHQEPVPRPASSLARSLLVVAGTLMILAALFLMYRKRKYL